MCGGFSSLLPSKLQKYYRALTSNQKSWRCAFFPGLLQGMQIGQKQGRNPSLSKLGFRCTQKLPLTAKLHLERFFCLVWREMLGG